MTNHAIRLFLPHTRGRSKWKWNFSLHCITTTNHVKLSRSAGLYTQHTYIHSRTHTRTRAYICSKQARGIISLCDTGTIRRWCMFERGSLLWLRDRVRCRGRAGPSHPQCWAPIALSQLWRWKAAERYRILGIRQAPRRRRRCSRYL